MATATQSAYAIFALLVFTTIATAMLMAFPQYELVLIAHTVVSAEYGVIGLGSISTFLFAIYLALVSWES